MQYCDSEGFPTGFFDGRPGCVKSLRRNDLWYFLTLFPRLIWQFLKSQELGTLSENNSICRSIHIILAQTDPETHCKHVAKNSTYCINA
jgi:hypothetical protein